MSFIYKYIPPERKTYLSDSLLRFTPPSALNDPFECLPGITDEGVEEGLIQFEKKLNETPDHLKKLNRSERRIELRHYRKNAKKQIKKLKKNPTQFTDFFYKQATTQQLWTESP